MCKSNIKQKEEKSSKTVKLQVSTVQECSKHSASTERMQTAEIPHFMIKEIAIFKEKKFLLLNTSSEIETKSYERWL